MLLLCNLRDFVEKVMHRDKSMELSTVIEQKSEIANYVYNESVGYFCISFQLWERVKQTECLDANFARGKKKVLYCASGVLACIRFYILWRRPRWRHDGFHVVQVRREKYSIDHGRCGFFETVPYEKVPLKDVKIIASFTRTEVATMIAPMHGSEAAAFAYIDDTHAPDIPDPQNDEVEEDDEHDDDDDDDASPVADCIAARVSQRRGGKPVRDKRDTGALLHTVARVTAHSFKRKRGLADGTSHCPLVVVCVLGVCPRHRSHHQTPLV